MAKVLGLHDPGKVEDYIARGWWTRETVDQVFRDRVAERGAALALVDPTNKAALVGTAPRRLTWTELAAEVDRSRGRAARARSRPRRRPRRPAAQQRRAGRRLPRRLAAGCQVSPLAMPYREHELTTMSTQAGFAAYVGAHRFIDRDLLAEAEAVRDRLPAGIRLVRYAAPDDETPAPEGVVDLRARPGTDVEPGARRAALP